MRQEKEDWEDLPEDARDPWGDDNGSSQKEPQWAQPQPSGWNQPREKETWPKKPTYPNPAYNSHNYAPPQPSQGQPPQPQWQPPTAQVESQPLLQQLYQSRAQPNWQQSTNNQWQGGSSSGVGGNSYTEGNTMLSNLVNNWQPQQQSFTNFQQRQTFSNNSAFTNNRR